MIPNKDDATHMVGLAFGNEEVNDDRAKDGQARSDVERCGICSRVVSGVNSDHLMRIVSICEERYASEIGLTSGQTQTPMYAPIFPIAAHMPYIDARTGVGNDLLASKPRQLPGPNSVCAASQ